MRDITFDVKGNPVNSDHISADTVKNEILPEVNKIWGQAGIHWNLENVIEEDVVKPEDSKEFEEMKSIVEEAERDENGHADPTRLVPLNEFMDPANMAVTGEHGQVVDLYLYPFTGNTSQGNANKIDGEYRPIIGTWSNKYSNGKTPYKMPITESWDKFQKGSISRTIAHELGYVLSLSHEGSNCLMHGNGYSIDDHQIEDAKSAALKLSGE